MSKYLLLLLVLVARECFAFQLSPHLRYDPSRSTLIDPNYSWVNRQTGIVPYWTTGLGYWEHYEQRSSKENEEPKPYTSGYMRKHLRLVNATSFELWSVYQPAATGKWLQGLMQKRADGNMDHYYRFTQTPYRINLNPLPNLPDGSTTRVLLVKPGSAILHGTLFVPTMEAYEIHQGPNWQFFELWLAEDYQNKKEGRKVGAVVEYHGLSGCLSQVFQIHEIAIEVSVDSPKNDVKFVDADLAPMFPLQTQRPEFPSPPVEADARIIHLINGPNGPEAATDTSGPLQENVLDPSLFFHIPLNNGAYLKIPKCFNNELNGEVCLEFGCRRADGDCHRLVVYGDRKLAAYHTVCYEKWSDEYSPQNL